MNANFLRLGVRLRFLVLNIINFIKKKNIKVGNLFFHNYSYFFILGGGGGKV